MKTVSGHIISSKPVSLSRAAKFLSNFVECDNGASRAVSTILQQTAEAFNELSDFHKKLKSSGPNRKSVSSMAISGISTPHDEPSALSAWSSEGEKVAEKSKGKNRRKEVDSDPPISMQEIRVDRSKIEQRHGHGEVSGNDLLGNPINGSEDNSEAVSEKKKRKKKHRQRNDPENGGEARERDEESNSIYNASEGSEGIRDDLSEMKKKKTGEERDDGLLENGITDDLLEKPSGKKRNKKKRKGQEGDNNGLLQNDTSTKEEENRKKRKNEGDRTSIEGDDGSFEPRRKKKKTDTIVGAKG